jgi:hypothetical protein
MDSTRLMRSYRLLLLTNDNWEALNLAFMLEGIEEQQSKSGWPDASTACVDRGIAWWSWIDSELYYGGCDGSSA